MDNLEGGRRPLRWVVVYAIAMGYLEAAVVVYLRRLYYPHGFAFPLAGMDPSVIGIEITRELATIVMLAAVGILAGRNRAERFAYFLCAFGAWDIVYYLGLKLTLGWPPSLLSWDILFLIPVPWVGPVLAPCIVALTMIAFALVTIRAVDLGLDAVPTRQETALMLAGVAVMLAAFMGDWIRAEGPGLMHNLQTHRSAIAGLEGYVPRSFPWTAFLAGEAAVVIGAWRCAARWLRAGLPDTRTVGVPASD